MGGYISVVSDNVQRINRRRTKRVGLSNTDTAAPGLFITGLGGQYPEHIYEAADFEHVVKSLCVDYIETPGYDFPLF